MRILLKTVGIVAEFNPFHNGHARFIEHLRDPLGPVHATHIVAVMSGNFVQRGEPAILSKYDRVKAALAGGVDLVIELPTPWVLQSAEHFAKGSISLLNALQVVDILAFGSECGDTEILNKISQTMQTDKYQSLLRYHIPGGISYAQAQQKALEEILGTKTASILEQPNNTLGIEYLKALHSLNSPIQFYTKKREGVEHDSQKPLGDLASASYIRNLLRENHYVNALPFIPGETRDILNEAIKEGFCPSSIENSERALLYKLRQMSPEDFLNFPGISEGLENRFYEAVQKSATVKELLDTCKTKRYPLTRLQRILWCAYLDISKEDTKGLPPYIRPLGATEAGMDLLRLAKKKGCTLPVISRVSKVEELDDNGKQIWEIEKRTSDLYGLTLPTPSLCNLEYTKGIIKINSTL